jgi:hypothetical protein
MVAEEEFDEIGTGLEHSLHKSLRRFAKGSGFLETSARIATTSEI